VKRKIANSAYWKFGTKADEAFKAGKEFG